MSDIAMCAKCGEEKPLCDSCRVDGIKQPRICKECLIEQMSTGDEYINDIYWITQISQLGDGESIAAIRKQLQG